MNTRRILLGGTLAGALIAAGSALFHQFVPDAVLAPAMPLAVSLLRSLLLGIGAVLLWAAIRPRFGAGAKSALTVGLLIFFAGVLFPPFELALGNSGGRHLLLAVIWNAAQIPLAVVAGAWLYQDEAQAVMSPAA